MKKILLITSILGMSLLFSGCPYEFTNTAGPTGPTPVLTPNVSLSCLGTSTFTWNAVNNFGTQVNLKFGAMSPANMYPLTIMDSAGYTLSPAKTSSCSCYFSNIRIDTATYIIMEVIQPAMPGSTTYNHIFAMVNATFSSLNGIYPFPAGMTNPSFQLGNTNTNPVNVITSYLTYLKNNPLGPFPPNAMTDGYDKDTEIKSNNQNR